MQPTLFTISTPAAGRLSTMARPRGGDWLDDELAALARGANVLVCLLTDAELKELELEREAPAAAAVGLTFHHHPIEDRQLPDERGQRLVATLTSEVQAGRHVVVHCRAGIGRSSVIAAAVLVSLGLDADTALARIGEARGLQVPDTREQADWVRAFTPR